MTHTRGNFTLSGWMNKEKESSSDLWIWRQIIKHFAYGKDLPTQLGNYSNLQDLYDLIIKFIDEEISKKNDLEIEFKEIKGKFKDKEKFDKFVKDIITKWSDIYKEFCIFYNEEINKIETHDRIITNEFVDDFIKNNKMLVDDFSNIFTASSEEYYKAFEKLFHHLEEKIWITNTYYSTPLFSSFNFYEPWRWFYLLWLYYELILEEISSDHKTWDNYFFKEIKSDDNFARKKRFPIPLCQSGCIVRRKPVNGLYYFISFGPVFSPHEKIFFNDKETYIKKIKPTILLFLIFQTLLNTKTESLFSKSLTEADIFLKACGTKPYIFNNTLETKIHNIKKLFDILVKTKIKSRKNIIGKPERHIWVLVSLLRWSIFIFDLIVLRKINTLSSDAFFPPEISLLSGYNNFNFSIKTKIKKSEILSFEIQKIESNQRDFIYSENRLVFTHEKNDHSFDKNKLDWLESEYIKFNSDFDIRTRTSKQPYLLAAWLRRHFYLQQDSGHHEFNKQHKPVCKNICELFDADGAFIYTYHHAQEKLKLISSWFADKNDMPHEKNLADSMLNLTDKENSICYRAVKFNTVQFTLAFNPGNKKAKASCKMLEFDEVPMRSGIAVPLLFKGRLLGILEITGKKEYQFGWTNREILNQTSIVLSTAFYQQRLVNGLHRITNTALDLKKYKNNTQKLYGNICKYISSIFLCDGASLWFKSEKDRNRYQCLGAYNDEYIIEHLKNNNTPLSYAADDVGSVEVDILLKNEKEFTDTFHINEKPLGKDWQGSAVYRKKIVEQGIKYCTYFSLQDQAGAFCGSITLYDRENLRYEDWDSMYLFISKFVSIILEAIDVFTVESKEIQDKKDHEIYGASKILLDRLDRIFHLFEEFSYLFKASYSTQTKMDDLKRKLRLVNYDLIRTKDRLNSIVIDQNISSENKINIEKLGISKEFNIAKSSYFKKLYDKKIECIFTSEDCKHPMIHINKNDFTTILSNLISNVCKYSYENETVVLSFRKMKSYWILSLTNRGVSLKKGEDKLILKAGYRSYYALENKIEGAGIGLSIVSDICKKYAIEFYYSSKNIQGENGNSLHIFTLEIPPKMVSISK